MAVSNDSVETNLMEIWCLDLQHLVDAHPVNLVGRVSYLLRGAIGATEPGLDDLLAIFVEQVECLEMSTCRDLDEFCEAVSNLSFWQRPQERKVEEGLDWGMVCTQSVLVVAVIDSDFDRDRCVN